MFHVISTTGLQGEEPGLFTINPCEKAKGELPGWFTNINPSVQGGGPGWFTNTNPSVRGGYLVRSLILTIVYRGGCTTWFVY